MLKTAARITVALGAVAALMLNPATAGAAPQNNASPLGDIRAAATGYFYANEAGTTDTRFPMRWCQWYNSDANWGNDCGGFRNVISYAFNDSSQGNVVRLYWTTNYGGAWACLGPGDAWTDFVWDNVRLTWGAGRGGYMAPANDNVSSHAFRTTCA